MERIERNLLGRDKNDDDRPGRWLHNPLPDIRPGWGEDEQGISESARSDDQEKDTPDTSEELSQNFIIVSGKKGNGYHSESS